MRCNLLSNYTLLLLLSLLLFSCNKQISGELKRISETRYSNSWEEIPGAPTVSGRHDDVCFVNASTGWVVNGRGEVFKTSDGGQHWELQFKKSGSYFRCIGFADDQKGWMGTIGRGDRGLRSNDSIILYETTNGGTTWNPITDFKGPAPTGLCGLQVVNKSFIAGCGRVRGPAYFIKSTDGGKTWHSKNLDDVAGSLITVHFFNADTGIMIGGTTTIAGTSKALVLLTTDQGETWKTVHTSSQEGEWCWKIEFPSRNTGYIAIQRNVLSGSFNFLKTIDGGRSWKEMKYSDKYYAQGIGFTSNSTGWIGGGKGTMETTDGGATWQIVDGGFSVNRYTMINDTIGFSVGKTVYKFTGYQPFSDGWETDYYGNKKIKAKHFYKDGLLDSKSIFYNQDGSLAMEGNYKKNLKHGVWTTFDKNNEVAETKKYKNGAAVIDKKLYEEYAGVYRIKEGSYRCVFTEKGQLYTVRNDNPRKYVLLPDSDKDFFYPHNFDLTITFVRDGQNKVSHHKFYNAGKESSAEKVGEEEAQKVWESLNKKK